MPVKQGDLELLKNPIAQQLLVSQIPARLAYIWTDVTPRVVPIWFHWNGSEFIMGTPPKAPKLKALVKNPKVALTIDDNNFPHRVLLVRGTAKTETVEGIIQDLPLLPKGASAVMKRKSLDPATWHYAFQKWSA